MRWCLPLLVSVLALAGCEPGGLVAMAPMPEALAALQPDARVQVETEPWLAFRPAGEEPAVGLVFYPGRWVDPRAYAPPARAIAAEGYLVVITPMPLDLAVLAPDRAVEVMAAFPAVRRWAVGGHSMGGGAAAHFARNHPAAVRGLVLWASFPAPIDDLSTQDLAVVSIYGTRDSLTTSEQIAASRRLLPPPPATRWVAIAGGNHAQFGWYGSQLGGTTATISREAQQAQTVVATLDLLARLGEQRP